MKYMGMFLIYIMPFISNLIHSNMDSAFFNFTALSTASVVGISLFTIFLVTEKKTMM